MSKILAGIAVIGADRDATIGVRVADLPCHGDVAQQPICGVHPPRSPPDLQREGSITEGEIVGAVLQYRVDAARIAPS